VICPCSVTLTPARRSVAIVIAMCGSDGIAGPACWTATPCGQRAGQQQRADELGGGGCVQPGRAAAYAGTAGDRDR
jgi:hypothetical protein